MTSRPNMVKVLDSAPNFKLTSTKGEVDLSTNLAREGYDGKWTVVFFYSGDFTSVCSTEVPEFARRYSDFLRLNAEVYGVSADSIYSHEAWIKQLQPKVEYPLLSDFKKETCRAYGILDDKSGEPLRGTFIIDPKGRVRFQMMIDPDLGQNVDEVLRVLQALQTGKACPVNWTPGQATL
ncbi:MAG TPA: peroxiredoxin [Candidatus Acidoferrales bacterium]|nr:peroxiredoxin [Candidatus Acidoferrales bacterium]